MRGSSTPQASMFVAVPIEKRIPADHPLRQIKVFADQALVAIGPELEDMYSSIGRPSIPPERLLKATLLMAFYTLRSERLFCERLQWDLLFQWFLDMDLNEPAFNHSSFSHNRDRLIQNEVAKRFFHAVTEMGKQKHLLSSEHFTVDGTLIESWASLKSFRAKNDSRGKDDGDPSNPSVDFRGEKRSNETHQSNTDPDAKLMRKNYGEKARLSYGVHALMENRNGLLVDLQVTKATGTAECEAALEMVKRNLTSTCRKTVGADKGYDSYAFTKGLRAMNVTPHVAAKSRRSTLDARTTRHETFSISQRKRKRVEEIFGWLKTVAGWRKTRYVGIGRNQHMAYLLGAAFNMVRMSNIKLNIAT